MPLRGECVKTLDSKWRLTFPAEFAEVGLGVLFGPAANRELVRILPDTFKPPVNMANLYQRVKVRGLKTRKGYLPRVTFGKKVRRRFSLPGLKPHTQIRIVGCGDHLELYPADPR